MRNLQIFISARIANKQKGYQHWCGETSSNSKLLRSRVLSTEYESTTNERSDFPHFPSDLGIQICVEFSRTLQFYVPEGVRVLAEAKERGSKRRQSLGWNRKKITVQTTTKTCIRKKICQNQLCVCATRKINEIASL